MWWVIGFFISLILFFYYFKKIPSIVVKILKKYNLLLNSDSLHSQRLFQLAISIPFFSSLYFMIWLGWEYPFRWDSIGFNAFLNIQKFSLGILALSPILGVFVVYAHRSLQTEKQIKTAEKQLKEAQKKNKIDTYFSRRKFIIEQLKDISFGSKNNVIPSPNSLYLKYYRTENYYHDTLILENIKKLNTAILILTMRMDKFSKIKIFDYLDKKKIVNSLHNHHDSIKKIDRNIYNVKKLLLIKDSNTNTSCKTKIQRHWDESVSNFNLEIDNYDKIAELDFKKLNDFVISINLRLKTELENIRLSLDEIFSILFNDEIIAEKLYYYNGYKKASDKIKESYMKYKALSKKLS